MVKATIEMWDCMLNVVDHYYSIQIRCFDSFIRQMTIHIISLSDSPLYNNTSLNDLKSVHVNFDLVNLLL